MEASGQKVNDTKSESYFMNTKPNVENQICKIMGYKKGLFPCKYLRIALEKSLKSSKVWSNTLEKLDTRLGCWKDKWLTKAGKSIKIISVLSAIPTFPLSCLPLPKRLFKFEAKLKNFLWNDCEEDKKLALIKWENICKPKDLGGLGIKNLHWQNEALGAKFICRLFKEREHQWAKILYNKYLNVANPLSIFRMKNLPRGSESWNFMIKCRRLVCKYLTWDVSKGNEALFWEDSWDGHPPINPRFIPKNLKDNLVNLWRSKVCNYKTKITSEGITRWIWKPLEDMGMDSAAIKAYEKITIDMRIKQSERKDELI